MRVVTCADVFVTGIFWMSECAKASRYAFIFLYTSIFKEYFGQGKSVVSKVLSPRAASSCSLMCLSWAVSWPDALPVLEQADGKLRRKLIFFFFFKLLFHPCPHNTALAWPTEAEASFLQYMLLLGLG